MAKKMSKRGLSISSGCAFLLVVIMFAAVSLHTFKTTDNTLDQAMKIVVPVLMLTASIVQLVAASRLPRETE